MNLYIQMYILILKFIWQHLAANDHAQQPIKLIEGFQFQEACLGKKSSLVPRMRS